MATTVVLVLQSAGDEVAADLVRSLHASAVAGRITVVAGSEEQLLPRAHEASALLVWDLSRAAVERLLDASRGAIRWVHIKSAGADWLLYPAAPRALLPAALTVTRGVYSTSLAEWAIAGALYFAKAVQRLERQKAERRWDKFVVPELRGRTACVVGYGSIGRAVATLMRAFGMRVVAVRRGQPSEAERAEGVYGQADLLQCLSRSQYVALALPLTAETLRSFGREQIAAMPAGAVLINVGRGKTVDEPALVEALSSGKLAGAALDVVAEEPMPAESALWGLPNVLISPHCADNTPEWAHDAVVLATENTQRFVEGRDLLYTASVTGGY